MTIEELKALVAATQEGEAYESVMLGEQLTRLAPEILALVEATNDARMADTTRRGIELILGDAIDAFNAKLEAL